MTQYNNDITIAATDEASVSIGSFCAFGRNLKVLPINHDWNYPVIQGAFYRHFFDRWHPGKSPSPTRERTKGNVVIGNDVWIGDDVIILGGVTIGNGCCVGAGSIVAKSLPPFRSPQACLANPPNDGITKMSLPCYRNYAGGTGMTSVSGKTRYFFGLIFRTCASEKSSHSLKINPVIEANLAPRSGMVYFLFTESLPSKALDPMENLKEFEYLAEKIKAAPFREKPFTHLFIENFLSDAHFEIITKQEQINLPVFGTIEGLIKALVGHGWQIQYFPGCTTSVEDYLSCYKRNEWPVDKERLEGYGLAFRLKRYDEDTANRLVTHLNSPHFKNVHERKFGIAKPNKIETAIHKYLSGYEISLHPDRKSKCLTYLVNINTDARADDLSIHTHLLKFKDEKRFIYDYWKYNEKSDTDWVPWDWCTTEVETRKNNSLVMFAPSCNTLHAVKLRYDHLAFQRTQLYGNLWYTDVPADLGLVSYTKFDIQPDAKKPALTPVKCQINS